jgi:serine/threonine-protein kinase RsbT
MAREMGFVIVDQIGVATAASELSRNAYQYSGTGKVIIKPVSRNHARGIEIVVEDQGPGIPDLEQALQDGFSASSGRGHGLPGSRRLVDEFEIESQTGAGTRVTIRKWLK